jgi:SAM-dependent methyltransferase
MRQHFYQKIPHWFDFEDVYREAIRRAPDRGARLVELGVYEGASLAFLAVEAIRSGKGIQITGVDKFDWPAGVLQRVEAWIREEKLGELVKLERSYSWDAADKFPDGSLDFVFVDASHVEADVLRDLRAFFPKLKPTGYMAGHDWCDEFPGVERACRKFFGDVGRKVAPCSARSWKMGP